MKTQIETQNDGNFSIYWNNLFMYASSKGAYTYPENKDSLISDLEKCNFEHEAQECIESWINKNVF